MISLWTSSSDFYKCFIVVDENMYSVYKKLEIWQWNVIFYLDAIILYTS